MAERKGVVREMREERGKAEQGWGNEAAGGMGSYEGEVIQLLSNLGATLLGGEPLVGGKLVLPTLSLPTIEPR